MFIWLTLLNSKCSFVHLADLFQQKIFLFIWLTLLYSKYFCSIDGLYSVQSIFCSFGWPYSTQSVVLIIWVTLLNSKYFYSFGWFYSDLGNFVHLADFTQFKVFFVHLADLSQFKVFLFIWLILINLNYSFVHLADFTQLNV